MKPEEFFLEPSTIAQKQYEALRMFFIEKSTATQVADRFGYTYRGFTTIVSNFRKNLLDSQIDTTELFFTEKRKGRKPTEKIESAKDIVVDLRKQYLSVEDIKIALDGKGIKISEKSIYNIIAEAGFARLPRREKKTKVESSVPKLEALKTQMLDFGEEDEFKSAAGGILCFLPYLQSLGIIDIIKSSDYPETRTINRLSSILCFIALKLSNFRRYSADNLWCMDRGLGLFAGLNVLPKAAWFTSYSDRVTPTMNREFLKKIHLKWSELGLLGDTENMDFTTIPYWGNDEPFENNWSGKRGKALASMLAVLAHDPDTGIISYGNTDIKHKNESETVLEFLDFYRESCGGNDKLNYLIFDSKFTSYENLSHLNAKGVMFITIRRRGKNLVDEIHARPASLWKKIRVPCGGNKNRTLKVSEDRTTLRGYDGEIRQIVITDHGKIKPAIIITNDFSLPTEQIVRKYSRRWNVEKLISEQIEFFHLNKVSSSMVIKVDFDLTISILAHNIYRLLANDLDRYSHLSDQSIYEKFIRNTAEIEIMAEGIAINLKKKRELPLMLETLNQFADIKYSWLGGKKIVFTGATYS